MNYFDLYQNLYELGYQNDKNIGLEHVDYLVYNYEFNSILDIGCAQGKAVEAYKDMHKDAYGIDVAKSTIDDCKEKGLKCVKASVTKIPFKRNNFDAVVTTDVLEHLQEKDVDKAVHEICRVTKRYIFARIAKTVEAEKQWLQMVREKTGSYKNVPNLHLTVKARNYWKQKFIEIGNVKFIEKVGKILVFEKNNITNII